MIARRENKRWHKVVNVLVEFSNAEQKEVHSANSWAQVERKIYSLSSQQNQTRQAGTDVEWDKSINRDRDI